MDDHPRVTAPGGPGQDGDDGDAAATGSPVADPVVAGDAPADGPGVDAPAAGGSSRPHPSTRPAGYEPL